VDFLIVPMRVGGATVGTLSAADWSRRGAVTQADVEWVQAAADRIGLSVELARLAGAVQADTLRLDLIRSIALAVRQRRDVGLVTRVVVDELTARLDVDAAEILLISNETNELVLASSAGFRVAPPRGLRFASGSVAASEAQWAPRVDRRADVDRKGHNPRGAHVAREGFQTFVTIPLHAWGRLLGVLELYNREVVDWEPRWLQFYDTLGGLVGLAIDHASPGLSDQARPGPGEVGRPNLSDLELEMLRLIVEGFTNREIAAQVHRSENTIKFHVRRILEKTGVSNRTELARRATREGWL
jgi:DNA-binding CsgD family transcriptional regulator/GAF domain-containing protein